MATDLDAIANLTGAGVTEAQAKTWFTAMRAALAEMGDPLGRYDGIQNLALSVVGAAGALTIALKDRDGSDPSAASPCSVAFRNVTDATGDFAVINVIAASSLVLTSGSTLGASSGEALRVWIVGFNDGGTFRLGAVNARSGTNIRALKDDVRESSTAEGAAGAADSAQVIYTGTAVSAKAMRILAYAEWSTLTTAGTWTTPTKVQLFGAGIPLPGQVVQEVGNGTGAVATGTTTLPYDDTIPQNTEGDQYMTQAVTPSSAANVLDIAHVGHYAHSSTTNAMAAALFQDSTAGALAAVAVAKDDNADSRVQVALRHRLLAGTASSTTFKIRAGNPNAGTTTFNGASAARLFGGVLASRLDVAEIMA